MTGSQIIGSAEVVRALGNVADALRVANAYLTELDQAMGDGDLGITTSKIADALAEYAASTPVEDDDLGKYLAAAGMAVNRAAPSTMGTLLATALMRAGRESRGLSRLDGAALAAMLNAADQGIQERGKAQVGDKTIVDALHPAAEAFNLAVGEGADLQEAAAKMLAAAEEGLQSVTPLRSRIGRASWVGERTEGRVDPGCAALVIIFKGILQK
jgi:phosphoenolpyruvate---glycerone phosphotransferase subunit DhaL